MSRLKEKYQETIKAALQKRFNYKNPMQIPALKKVVINMGIAEAAKDKNLIPVLERELGLLSGQKPVRTKAKKSVANFKLREGMIVGLMVTLRGNRMYDFVDRFCNIVAPRIRDFRGFPTKADGRGCLSIGLNDQQVFPELNLDQVKRTQGMNITFVTTCDTDDECVALLTDLGMPFKDNKSGKE